MINKSRSPIAICLIIFRAHMNIFSSTKVKMILVFITCSNMTPIMLNVDPRMVIICWARSSISFKHVFFGVCSKYHTYHIPLKFKCPEYFYVGFRHVYLRSQWTSKPKLEAFFLSKLWYYTKWRKTSCNHVIWWEYQRQITKTKSKHSTHRSNVAIFIIKE